MQKAYLSNTCLYQLFTVRQGEELQYCSKTMSFFGTEDKPLTKHLYY